MTHEIGVVASVPDAVDALRRGDRRILARLLSLLEDGVPSAVDVMAKLRDQPVRLHASVLAITGPPGVGKSTLVAALARIAAGEGSRVSILAVDPSSQVTGGAVLGDRIRMAHELDERVFIRSFASRGVVGGLARVVPDAIELVEAAGYDLVFVETVGVGQSEIDVARHAEVTVVVLAPYLGDEVQAAKAGLMEIADAYIVNKCDLPESGRAVRDVRASNRLRHVGRRDVPVLKASATTGERIPETWTALSGMLKAASADPDVRLRRMMAARADEFGSAAVERVRQVTANGPVAADSVLGRVLEGRMSAAEAVTRLAEWLTEGGK
jgi:GTPase